MCVCYRLRRKPFDCEFVNEEKWAAMKPHFCMHERLCKKKKERKEKKRKEERSSVRKRLEKQQTLSFLLQLKEAKKPSNFIYLYLFVVTFLQSNE